MGRSAWYGLAMVATVGWAIAVGLAFALVSRIGWFGVLMIGLFILFAVSQAELHADSPAVSLALMRRRYEQTVEEAPSGRLARLAERIERNRLLYIARSIGIAMALLGLNMFIAHQL